MPWWTVTGREPTRMERWAAYLLPPLNMGEGYIPVGGRVSASLDVLEGGTYEVVSSVTTRYRAVRASVAAAAAAAELARAEAEREKAAREGAASAKKPHKK